MAVTKILDLLDIVHFRAHQGTNDERDPTKQVLHETKRSSLRQLFGREYKMDPR